MTNLIIAVDFGGTIADHRFPEIGEPVPFAFEFMKLWQDVGVKIILHTIRSDSEDRAHLKEVVDFVEDRGVTLFGANLNPDQARWSSSPKTYAHICVDDAAYGCPMMEVKGFSRPCVDWKIVGPDILRRVKS